MKTKMNKTVPLTPREIVSAIEDTYLAIKVAPPRIKVKRNKDAEMLRGEAIYEVIIRCEETPDKDGA